MSVGSTEPNTYSDSSVLLCTFDAVQKAQSACSTSTSPYSASHEIAVTHTPILLYKDKGEGANVWLLAVDQVRESSLMVKECGRVVGLFGLYPDNWPSERSSVHDRIWHIDSIQLIARTCRKTHSEPT